MAVAFQLPCGVYKLCVTYTCVHTNVLEYVRNIIFRTESGQCIMVTKAGLLVITHTRHGGNNAYVYSFNFNTSSYILAG